MTLRVVIDTNIWIRILLKGRVTLPILEAFNQHKFQLVMSQPLMEELPFKKADWSESGDSPGTTVAVPLIMGWIENYSA